MKGNSHKCFEYKTDTHKMIIKKREKNEMKLENVEPWKQIQHQDIIALKNKLETARKRSCR